MKYNNIALIGILFGYIHIIFSIGTPTSTPAHTPQALTLTSSPLIADPPEGGPPPLERPPLQHLSVEPCSPSLLTTTGSTMSPALTRRPLSPMLSEGSESPSLPRLLKYLKAMHGKGPRGGTPVSTPRGNQQFSIPGFERDRFELRKTLDEKNGDNVVRKMMGLYRLTHLQGEEGPLKPLLQIYWEHNIQEDDVCNVTFYDSDNTPLNADDLKPALMVHDISDPEKIAQLAWGLINSIDDHK